MSFLTRIIAPFRVTEPTRRFRAHAASHTPTPRHGGPEILVEAFQPASNVVALSVFTTELAALTASHIVGYHQLKGSILEQVAARLRYRGTGMPGFGARHLRVVRASRRQRKVANELYRAADVDSLDPWGLEQLEIMGVKVGDLAYDVYLRRTGLPTADFGDPRLAATIRECIEYGVYWHDYFTHHPVTAVCVSHCVYQHGIPARFALAAGVPVYQVNAQSLYLVTPEFPHAYTDFFLYHQRFETLDPQVKEAGLALAKDRLERRFAGEVGVDMPYSTASAYAERTAPTDAVLRPSDRTKVLVAVHDFHDSPHSFGDNLYPDFYIWLYRLGELSRQVDYDWYIKTHPDFRGDGPAVLARFVEEFPNFTILPSTTSHHDIVRDGINVALTVYGTIAMEYAAMGRAVVNASRFNPHVGYAFSLTPRDRQDYEDIVLHLDDLDVTPTIDDVLEYYYMHLIYPLPGWVFSDFQVFLDRVGGYDGSMTDAAYDAYVDDFDADRDRMTRKALRRFIASGDIRLDRRHFANEELQPQ